MWLPVQNMRTLPTMSIDDGFVILASVRNFIIWCDSPSVTNCVDVLIFQEQVFTEAPALGPDDGDQKKQHDGDMCKGPHLANPRGTSMGAYSLIL